MRTVMRVIYATVVATVLALVAAPLAAAQGPWFADRVGGASQVIAVNGTGGTHATLEAWQRSPVGWHRITPSLPATVADDGALAAARGVFRLEEQAGATPSPDGGLAYRTAAAGGVPDGAGEPALGRVAVDATALQWLTRWLQPGAVIAIGA
ncbi:hypothetical protein ACFWPA_03900 [Rhodococcus sp. NPDC058505]|uniref:hypothetical protein n=1 Tax=unclassified Rhodococcus (in: high G+C Gram-positive bacteria) TaxID=192944 RepID=UPI00364E4867